MSVLVWASPTAGHRYHLARSWQRPSHARRYPLMPNKTPARRLTPGPDRDKLAQDLKKRYDSGASIRALAQETGRSYGGVHRLLEDAGATFRSRGGASRRTES
ncbi:helix-turn-helix domain-containing protein [Streptomyces eurythermus]